MTITKNVNDEKLEVVIAGRLDTSTAPELEKELSALDGVKELVLAFEKLEYVSSAGLRVLLASQKAMMAAKGQMKIHNVNETIMEVFEITGFADILTIE